MREYFMNLILNSYNPGLFGFSFAIAMFVIAFFFWFGVAILGLNMVNGIKNTNK
jgi:hypothetical protein